MADMDVYDASWKRTAKDLVAGAAAGIAQVLLGMSFCLLHFYCWRFVLLSVIRSKGLLIRCILPPLPSNSTICVLVLGQSASFLPMSLISYKSILLFSSQDCLPCFEI